MTLRSEAEGVSKEKNQRNIVNCCASSSPKQCPLPVAPPPFVPNRIEWTVKELFRGTTPAAAAVSLLMIMTNGLARREESIQRLIRRGEVNPPHRYVTISSIQETRPITNSTSFRVSLQASGGRIQRKKVHRSIDVVVMFMIPTSPPITHQKQVTTEAKKCARNQYRGVQAKSLKRAVYNTLQVTIGLTTKPVKARPSNQGSLCCLQSPLATPP